MEYDITNIIFGLVGGLAIFIYGMNLMGNGLQNVAGEKMRKVIEALTSNPLLGILVGAVVTTLMQSSSATTVLVVGFVTARLMTLPQAIGVIMGANIGTTATAWLVSIKIGHYAYPITAVGFIIYFFIKKKKIKYIGQVLFSFGLLFVGLNTMSTVMKPLAKAQVVADLMENLSQNRGLGLLVGTVVTAVVQSSSAAIAVLQNLSATVTESGDPLIPLAAAIPILFGSNIGTTVTAILASIGASTNAKRAALAHSIFNILGSLIFIWFVPLLVKAVEAIMFGNLGPETMKLQIAYSHTIFNVTNTIIWIPFIAILAKAVTLIFPGNDKDLDKTLIFIDDKVLSTPAAAMNLAVNELVRMMKIVENMVLDSKKSFIHADPEAIIRIEENENTVDMLQLEIINYLTHMLSEGTLTEQQSLRLTGLIHITHDIERIGDHCTNISEFADSKIKNKLPFSEKALDEISEAFYKIEKIVSHATTSLEKGNLENAHLVLAEEEEIDDLEVRLRSRHLGRLNNGQCSPTSAVTFIELVHNMERISDNCKNIAEAVIDDYEKHGEILKPAEIVD